MGRQDKILNVHALAAWRAAAGREAAAVGVVSGTFDMITPANLAALRYAARETGRVCAIVEDIASSACRWPQERAELLSYLREVAGVFAAGADDADRAASLLRPFTWAACQDCSPGPVAEVFAQQADRTVSLPAIQGCSAADVTAAIKAKQTPISLPRDYRRVHTARRERPDNARERGVLVTVNGCFDVLHVGHARFLERARALGDRLTVMLNDDDSVRRYKGPSRPVFPADFREEALLSLESVSRVVRFGEDDPLKLLAELKPDIHVKGGSYEPDRVKGERALVEGWGGRLEFLPLEGDFSTTGALRSITG